MRLFGKVGYPEEEKHSWTLDLTHNELIELLIKEDKLLEVFNEWIKTNRKDRGLIK